jgi:hypothetical protein
MKKQIIYFTVLVSLIFTGKVYSQCGLHPKFEITIGAGVTVDFSAYQTGVDANWKITKYKWIVNNIGVDSGSILNPSLPYNCFLPPGYSKVELKVWGTDTTTNDTCSAIYGNVFSGLGSIIYPEMQVTSTGLDASVDAHWFGDPMGIFNIFVDWGDGSPPDNGTFPVFFHTYASAGNYLVTVTVQDNFGNYTNVDREIHVDNGYANYNVYGLSSDAGCNNISGGSLSLSPSGSGVTTGTYDIYYYGFNNSIGSGSFNLGSNFTVPTTDLVPGIYMLKAIIDDPIGSPDITQLAPFVATTCGLDVDTLHGFVFSDLDYDGIKDTNEIGLPNLDVTIGNANYSTKSDSAGFFEVIVPKGTLTIYLTYNTTNYTISYPNTPSYTINNQPGTPLPNLIFGLSPLTVLVKGNVFYDYNSNGTFNTGVDVYPKTALVNAIRIGSTPKFYAYIDGSGNYSLKLPPGSYNIKVNESNVDSLTSSPTAISINAVNATFNNQNFRLNTTVKVNFDLKLTASDGRPGFLNSVNAKLNQFGRDSAYGVVTINYDPAITIGSISPANGVIDTVTHTVQWSTTLMKYGVVQNFKIYYTIAIGVPLGTRYYFSANASVLAPKVDYHPQNNSDADICTVVGSFDPNDKSVHPAGTNGVVGVVYHNTRLNYHVNFQNTGTASAININIQDVLNSNLDLNTLVLEGASHPCTYSVDNNTITWKFMNIFLPDSNTNEPLSHGWVEFSIKPKQGLPDGTVITNEAAIYFDFNEPIITNTVSSTLQTVITSVLINDDNEQPIVYPIPVNDVLHIKFNSIINGKVVLKLYSADGRLHEEQLVNIGQSDFIDFDFSKFNNGVYIMELINDGKSRQIKIVK